MIPRPAGCNGPDCFYEGGWHHYPDCATQSAPADSWPDMAAETALEDGVWRRTPTTTTPARRAA